MTLRLRVAVGVLVAIALAGCTMVSESEKTFEAFDEVVGNLQVDDPTPRSPLQMKAGLIPAQAAPGETVRLVVKVRLMPGWHFYDYVPATEPYVQTKWLMEMGDGLQSSGDWNGPESVPYIGNFALRVYEGGEEPMVFYRELVVSEGATGELAVKAGMHFQVCDEHMCLPARTRTEDLTLKVTNR